MTREVTAERVPANADMVEGYFDGFNLDSPEPSLNRSRSYRHGFENGRADKTGQPFEAASIRAIKADAAMAADAMDQMGDGKP